MSADFKSGTGLTGKILYANQLTATTVTTLYTVPALTGVNIKSASACNPTGAQVNLTIFLVPSGSSADTVHQLIPAYPIPAGATIILDALVGAFLAAGDFISAQAASANAINLTITGVLQA